MLLAKSSRPVPGRVQRRFDKLSAMENLNPRQQQRLAAMTQKYGSQLTPTQPVQGAAGLGGVNIKDYIASMGGTGPRAGIPAAPPSAPVGKPLGGGMTMAPDGVGDSRPQTGMPYATGPQTAVPMQNVQSAAPSGGLFKKGGEVKKKTSSTKSAGKPRGWGLARGAKAAKVY